MDEKREQRYKAAEYLKQLKQDHKEVFDLIYQMLNTEIAKTYVNAFEAKKIVRSQRIIKRPVGINPDGDFEFDEIVEPAEYDYECTRAEDFWLKRGYILGLKFLPNYIENEIRWLDRILKNKKA